VRDSEFGGSTKYRIVVKGELGREWSDRLAGLAITADERAGQSPKTMLVGRIRDQAKLNGVLESLYSLHLTILQVEQIEDDSSELR